MWSIPVTHPKTVSQSGRITVFTKPHGSQTIVGEPCRRQLSPVRFSGDLISGQRAHQQERLPPIYLPMKSSSENSIACAHTHPYPSISGPARELTRRRVWNCFYTCLLQQVRLPLTSPSIHSTRLAVAGKALLFQFFSSATVTGSHLSPESPLFLCFLELYDIFRTLGVDSY